MITYEWTTDYGTIRDVLTEKRCYTRMINDGSPSREDFAMVDMERFTCIMAREDGNPIAVVLLSSQAIGYAGVDFCFAPEAWGRSVEIGRDLLRWIWGNTHLVSLRGETPSYNRLALRFAEECGFDIFDMRVGMGTKNGKTYNLILTEAKRP